MLNILALIAGILLLVLYIKPEVEGFLYRRSPLYRSRVDAEIKKKERRTKRYGM